MFNSIQFVFFHPGVQNFPGFADDDRRDGFEDMDFLGADFFRKNQVQTNLLDNPNFWGNLALRRIITPKMGKKQTALRLDSDASFCARKRACTQTSTKSSFF